VKSQGDINKLFDQLRSGSTSDEIAVLKREKKAAEKAIGSRKSSLLKGKKGLAGAVLLIGSLVLDADSASAEDLKDALTGMLVPLPLAIAPDVALAFGDLFLESGSNVADGPMCEIGPIGGDELANEFTGGYGALNRRRRVSP